MVSVLYREPKLLKYKEQQCILTLTNAVSVLYREPKLLKYPPAVPRPVTIAVSVLYREPKLLKLGGVATAGGS